MTQVSDKTLAWLYSVLHEYLDPQRTYSDVARTLSTFPSIAPRTEVYTYENGSSALLLTLAGNLPVTFRGATYHFPIKIWVSRNYPQEPPWGFIIPGRDLQIRPGQHVGIDGRVYHPYLHDWIDMWNRANVTELLQHLQHEFSREPPLVARTQQQPAGNGSGQQNSLPILPPKQRAGESRAMSTQSPPPRPPKAGQQEMPASSPRDVRRDGPPLPPLPSQQPQRPASAQFRQQQSYTPQPPPIQIDPRMYAAQAGQQNNLSKQPVYNNHQIMYERSPVSPIAPANGTSIQFPQQNLNPSMPAQHPLHQQRFGHQEMDAASSQYQSHRAQAQTQPVKAITKPAPDLLSDPFDVAIPTTTAPVAAPPIPPNPEKEHLLQALSTTLAQQAQQKVQQNVAAITPLQAQHTAMRTAYSRLEAELAQLQALDRSLSSNEAILHRSIQECDQMIENAKTKKQPSVDDVLVAPTLLAQQLWTISAEEAACREAMYALQKAVDRGRVRGDDFVRQMRGLGRERFLKMALARKCAQGLGLNVTR